MTKQIARGKSYGPWIHPLLRSHARSIPGGTTEDQADFTRRSRIGDLITLDMPSPARGYALLSEDEPTLQLHVLATEGDKAIKALFSEIRDRSGGSVHVVPTGLVSENVREAIIEHGERFGIHLSDDREPESPAGGETQMAKLEVVDEGASGEVVNLVGEKLTDEDQKALDESGERPPALPVAPEEEASDDETAPSDDDVKASRYAKMRRPELEAIAKERSVFIPRKIDELRRALLDTDDDSEHFES